MHEIALADGRVRAWSGLESDEERALLISVDSAESLDELAARYKEKSAADGLALRVSTSFGSRLYRAEDGLTIIAVRPDGSETDITAAVLRTAGAGGQEKEGDS